MMKSFKKTLLAIFLVEAIIFSLISCNEKSKVDEKLTKINDQYVYIEYSITPEGLVWSEKENMWVNPLKDGTYNFDTIRTGRTDDVDTINKLFDLVNWENYSVVTNAYDDPNTGAYDYLDTDINNSGILTLEFINNVGNKAKIAMDKNGHMVLMMYYYVGERYEELADTIYQETLKKPEEVNDEPIMYNIPEDLYSKVAEILFSLSSDPYEEYVVDELDSNYSEANGKKYYYSDIGCDSVEMLLLCDNLNVISEDYDLNFTIAMGSDKYDDIWNIFKGIGKCEQIQSNQLNISDEKHMIIIAPDGYEDFNEADAITIYGDHGIIKASCKTDEIYFKMSENMLGSCSRIAAMK